MTDDNFKPGERVHVEFDTTVHPNHTGKDNARNVVSVLSPIVGLGLAVRQSSVTRIKPALPTTRGSVIKITRWGWQAPNDPRVYNWWALLTGAGWHIEVDSSAVYSAEELQKRADAGRLEWELIRDAGAEVPND